MPLILTRRYTDQKSQPKVEALRLSQGIRGCTRDFANCTAEIKSQDGASTTLSESGRPRFRRGLSEISPLVKIKQQE